MNGQNKQTKKPLYRYSNPAVVWASKCHKLELTLLFALIPKLRGEHFLDKWLYFPSTMISSQTSWWRSPVILTRNMHHQLIFPCLKLFNVRLSWHVCLSGMRHGCRMDISLSIGGQYFMFFFCISQGCLFFYTSICPNLNEGHYSVWGLSLFIWNGRTHYFHRSSERHYQLLRVFELLHKFAFRVAGGAFKWTKSYSF